MAIVILGGLISATALNMVVLPALYWLYGERTAEAPTTEAAEWALADPAPGARTPTLAGTRG